MPCHTTNRLCVVGTKFESLTTLIVFTILLIYFFQYGSVFVFWGNFYDEFFCLSVWWTLLTKWVCFFFCCWAKLGHFDFYILNKQRQQQKCCLFSNNNTNILIAPTTMNNELTLQSHNSVELSSALLKPKQRTPTKATESAASYNGNVEPYFIFVLLLLLLLSCCCSGV